MATPYMGEIRAVGFTFAPQGWVSCNGQTLPINNYEALYTLLGTTYGGDGVNTFNVPNLNGAVAVGAGQGPGRGNYVPGQTGGATQVTLTANGLPPHAHPFSAALGASSSAASSDNPAANLPTSFAARYAPTSDGSALASSALVGALLSVGGSAPHDNMQPSLALNYIICTEGIYPSRP